MPEHRRAIENLVRDSETPGDARFRVLSDAESDALNATLTEAASRGLFLDGSDADSPPRRDHVVSRAGVNPSRPSGDRESIVWLAQ